MLKVLDIFRIGDKLSVTLEGKCEEIKNGSQLIDDSGKKYEILSVAMVRSDNPSDFSKTTTVRAVFLCPKYSFDTAVDEAFLTDKPQFFKKLFKSFFFCPLFVPIGLIYFSHSQGNTNQLIIKPT